VIGRRAAGIAALLLGACAQAPTHELEITKARVEMARQQDAAIFAPELFADAESSLAQAQRLVDVEGNHLAAIQAASHATLRANEAFARASSERIVVVRRLDQLLFELGGLLEMAALRGASEKSADELAAFRTRFDAVRTMVEGRDLLEALAIGNTLKPELVAFEERFRDAR
jgi:hypothetical protein